LTWSSITPCRWTSSARSSRSSYNAEREFERNRERYEFLKWGQQAFDNFRVVPPATGIVHQVNLEYLARSCRRGRTATWSRTPTAVGTDSHTTMINGLGVLGWGVGGIEAEAVMLGQPIYMLTPQVVGFKLTGAVARRLDRDGPGPYRHADAAPAGGGRQVRRVLRAWPLKLTCQIALPSPTWRRNTAQPWASSQLTTDAELPGAERRGRGTGRPRGAVHQGAGLLPHRRLTRSHLHRHARVGHERGRAEHGGATAPAGPRGLAGCGGFRKALSQKALPAPATRGRNCR
jgi:hypothetical protein